MWKLVGRIPLALMVALALASCHTAPQDASNPPESAQAIRESLKTLYMDCSAAPPGSIAQQKLVLRMAEKASNGKELLLTLRAVVGVFPESADRETQRAESHLRSIITAKMMKLATLDQLIECAMRDAINREDAQPFVQHMFRLADQIHDARVWYRIQLAAFHLNASDLAQQAQAKGDLLAGKQENLK
jgi:hypothetical protein